MHLWESLESATTSHVFLQVQTDTNSSCSSTDDEVDEARDETDGDGASPSVVSSGNGEALHDTEARVLREIEALASTALQLPGGLTSTDKQPTLPPPLVGHANPIASSNRNSAASLDSGRGSAYATSSDGTKTVSTGVSATFPQPYHHVSTSVDYGQAKCPHLASGATPPYYMSPPASLCSPSRRTPQGYHRTPSAHPSASTCSSASSASSGASSGGSSCSSCSGASGNVSSDRTPVELLVNWLSSAGFSDYTTCLVSAGYDLSTLRRATPEDLNACGVTNPRHRQQLRARLSRLQLPENLPDHIPVSVFEWLSILNLTNYWPAFQSQGLLTFEKISVLTWEDLEEIGITKLGHQKKLILAVERLRRALAKRDEDQAGGGDSLTRHCRAQKHQVLSSPSHSATAAVPVVEEAEGGDGGLPDPTPPPPPAFQDPPLPGRKTSVDFSAAYGSSGSSHHRHHFSTSYLTDVERVPAGDGVGGEGSTKSDPLPRSAREGGSEEQSEGTHKSLQHPPQPPFSDVFLPTRQRHRAATAAATSATLAIPVSVANQMIPPLASGTAMDKDLQDMQDIRSMLDKLSEHLVPRGSP
ncbi:unnamed protein product [Mesocestoides corti]|uniref:SAM domain-containing protein n=2 Tax=Mesocestoides corti TaxID=53468 RepID=A0A158QWD3_MESCO|nr:unnamed protein product [Mesocestoides corti]